ncbi:unnamed protein product [Urochloa decumbens]|uniref:Rieske domain-containing protein n=2 Tax=Urochloa decumbens TaxID=240449 RepID=A0ABC9AJU6_9POAL
MSRIASFYSPPQGGLIQQRPRRLPVSVTTASLNSSWRRRRGGRRLLPVSPSGVAQHKAPLTSDAPSESGEAEQQFDWLDQWYPFAPVCDLDPGAPHGKTVLGLSLVAWYDRRATGGAGEWRVFDDACPHRLAPLSEGRIDGKGRLQCVYHGWCFGGAGGCEFIPQAPALGPAVHESGRARVGSYPCVVQNKLLWFYPRKEAEYKDVLRRKRPPYIPQIDDPSYFTEFGMRDLLYGYDVLVENIIDPSHLPYAHKGLDEEGGVPMKAKIEQGSIEGFVSAMEGGNMRFQAPCTVHGTSTDKVAAASGKAPPPHLRLVAFCIPVGPGRSRLIWGFPTNVGVGLAKIIPRWFNHVVMNSIIDSDAYLVHFQERKYAAVGLHNWHKASYVPTSSDSMIVAYRSWFRKYCRNQVGWATPQSIHAPPTPTKQEVLERYWSHVVQCTSCSAALKAMKAVEVFLQVMSVAVVGFLAVTKETLLRSAVQRTMVVSAAVLCFMASRWLADFIEKNFYFQDYVHAYR